jgi:hypothetical protein
MIHGTAVKSEDLSHTTVTDQNEPPPFCHLLVGILVSQLEYAESVIDWLQHAEMLLDHKKVESGHMPSC